MSHGGPRQPGPGKSLGAPPKRGVSKVAFSGRLTPEVLDYLKSTGNVSETLEDVVRRTKGFRHWKRTRRLARIEATMATTNATLTSQMADALDAYESIERTDETPYNVWEDVIFNLAEPNQIIELSESAFILVDGPKVSVFTYSESEKEWSCEEDPTLNQKLTVALQRFDAFNGLFGILVEDHEDGVEISSLNSRDISLVIPEERIEAAIAALAKLPPDQDVLEVWGILEKLCKVEV